MKKFLLCIIAISLFVTGIFAQNKYALQIETDKKILNIDCLGLPESATIYEALSTLPELLSRTKESVLVNYDIKIDGFSLGSTYESTLSQIRLSQVQRIEINDSAVDSYKNNGQGGSIDIILKDLNDGFSGDMSLSAYSLVDIKPRLLLGYKKNGLSLRGFAEYNYYQPYDVNSMTQGYSDVKELPFLQADTTYRKYQSQAVRLLLEYRPSDKDKFNLRFSESSIWDKQNLVTNTKQGSVYKRSEKQFTGEYFNLDVNTKFEHTFNSGSKFLFETTYSHAPAEQSTIFLTERSVGSDDITSTVSGKVEYEHHFRTANKGNFSYLIFGLNTNLASTEDNNLLVLDSNPDERIIINSIIHNWFLSPYAKYDARLGKWRLKAELEYQSFNYLVRGMGNEKFTKRRGDLTGKIMAGWQINGNNHLQLILDRKLERPDGSMLYPYLVYDPNQRRYGYGNPELKPMLINGASLNYITNGGKGGKSYVINTELSYMMVNDMITAVKYPTGKDYGECVTFINSGVNHILAAEVSATYSTGILSVTFTGNLYNNHQILENGTDNYTYYNLSLFPTVSFGEGWDASSKLTYHSRITTSISSVGDATTLSLSVGKNWKKFGAYVMGILPLNGKSKDISQGEWMNLEKTYYYVHPYAGLTVSYKF